MIFIIAARELRSLFLSPLAWTLLAVAQGLLAWIFIVLVDDFQQVQGRLINLENPPGVPLAVPGEELTDELLKNLSIQREAGVSLRSTSGGMPKALRVVE